MRTAAPKPAEQNYLCVDGNPSEHSMADKRADLAGPGTGDYFELEKVLPTDYNSLLSSKETHKALFEVKRYIKDNLCRELNLMMVEVPLIVDEESGGNDLLDRDGSRTPVAVPHFQLS